MRKFTCFVKEEDGQYASLCLELDVASCGNTKKEAIAGLRNAIAEYLEFMVSEGREDEVDRPVPMNELKNYLFPENNTIEQYLEAISLEFEYA